MPILKIFTAQEEKYFNTPLALSEKQWSDTFHQIKPQVEKLRSKHSKVGFALQFAYFKYTNKFFSISEFQSEDIDQVLQLLKLSRVKLEQYSTALASSHRSLILELTGVLPFEQVREEVNQEVYRLIQKQLRPKQIFQRIIELLALRRAEVPGIYSFSEMITQGFIEFEKELLTTLKTHLTNADKFLLSTILEGKDDLFTSLSKLKSPNQALRPHKIKQIVSTFRQIKEAFFAFSSIYKKLNMNREVFSHYASWTATAYTYQLQRFSDDYKKWLYLLAFVHHQYCIRQDYLIDILLQSVQHTLTKAERLQAYNYALQRKQHQQLFKEMKLEHIALLETQKNIAELIIRDELTAEEKVEAIKVLLLTVDQSGENFEVPIEDEQESFFKVLHQLHRKLYYRVGDLMKEITFNPVTSNQDLIKALTYFQTKKTIGKKAPIEFIPNTMLAYVYDDSAKLIPVRYKIMLYIQIADAIKAGSLNLLHSYKYLSVEEYMIDDTYWQTHRRDIMLQTGLTAFEDVDHTLEHLKKVLHSQYITTNQHILSGENVFCKVDKKGNTFVHTPSIEKPERPTIYQLLKPSIANKIPLIDLLVTAHQSTGFVDCFQHLNLKRNRSRPELQNFFAALIGYGCNLGIETMSASTKGLMYDNLLHVVQWYFSLENIQAANNEVLKAIEQLEISNLFVQNLQERKTASDGQKYPVSNRNIALHATPSFKYFGSGRGVSVYTFNNEKGSLFHSNVLTAADRESMYVIDGLVKDEIIKSKWHTTDTEGFNEVIFAVTHLMGIQFAPRIKNYKKQQLYTFKPKSEFKAVYQKNDYPILPDKYINIELIKEQWDNTLRFTGSILSREVTPSQLFKRLNSYSKQHPLYRALKEFGKIIKTLFILTYYDDLDLRQSIEYRLNMIELTQAFSKAVFFANNQELQYETIEEQGIATGCKQLIQNCIILWNYMQLTQLILDTKDEAEKLKIIDTIQAGNILTWRHVNFYGIYDFSKIEVEKQSYFDIEKIKNFRF